MYDAVESSRSAAPVARLSSASDPLRPVARTEEAAVCSALPVSSRASSIFLPAARPNFSMDSLASVASSDACSVTVFKVVKMFLLRFAIVCPCTVPAGKGGHVCLHAEMCAPERSNGCLRAGCCRPRRRCSRHLPRCLPGSCRPGSPPRPPGSRGRLPQ